MAASGTRDVGCRFAEGLELLYLAPLGQPIAIAAEPPRRERAIIHRPAAPERGHAGLHFGQGIEPGQDLAAGLAIEQARIERIPDGLGQAGDLASAGGRWSGIGHGSEGGNGRGNGLRSNGPDLDAVAIGITVIDRNKILVWLVDRGSGARYDFRAQLALIVVILLFFQCC